MARPKTKMDIVTEHCAEHNAHANIPSLGDGEIKPAKVFAKICHLAIGIDLLGSATSLAAGRGRTLEVTAIGIKAHSDKTNRTVVIPYSNIKGFELI